MSIQVLPGTGKGWQLFWIKSSPSGTSGDIRTRIPLDFENIQHRRGFRFMVQVSDQVSKDRLFIHKNILNIKKYL